MVLQDVLQRMERGTLSIYVRATSEHKKQSRGAAAAR